jgi:thiamine phosphate synthase YjbQ (UPF0047 family)
MEKMNNELKKDFYNYLENKLLKSQKFENDYNSGKNKIIRKEGLKNLKNEIEDFEYNIEKRNGLLELILPKSSEFGNSIFWNELISVQYFNRDLKEILEKLKKEM